MNRPDNAEYGPELPSINRNAVILEPTEAYLEWAKQCPDTDPELTLDRLGEGASVFLIPEQAFRPDRWLERHYKALFECELDAWCTDETYWPEKLSLRLFRTFFRMRFCSIVLDMGKTPLAWDDD